MADFTLREWELEELLSHSFPRPLYLCKPIFPSGGIALLHGPPGLGKTQLALSLANAVATGQDFLRYECAQGPVAFFQVDTPEEVFQDRLRKAYGWGTEDVSPLPPLMVVTSAHEQNVEALAQRPPPAVEAVQEIGPALVIVDSLNKTHELDENENAVPRRVYAAWRKLFPQSAFLFIHHDRKASDGIELVSNEAFRGAGAWMANADVGLHLVRVAGDMQLHFSKIRTADAQRPITLKMDEETLLVDRSDRPPALVVAQRYLDANPGDLAGMMKHLVGRGYHRTTASRALEQIERKQKRS